MGLTAAESNVRSQDTEVLYREHGAAVARLCRSLLRDRAEAEDATQQVFLAAHRALLNGSAPREPLAWLLAVARHECYARFRQRTATPVPTGDVPDGSTPDASVHVLRARELATVWDEVGRMPRAQREAFLLREVRGLSYGQLAAELSLSTQSVRSLLLRARRRLRHRMRDVAAGLGGAQWVQSLVRLAGGDGASPVPAATKAAAIGLGAIALVGGGDLARVPHHLSNAPKHEAEHHQAHARGPADATPTTAAVATGEGRAAPAVRHAQVERSGRRSSASRNLGSGAGVVATSSDDGTSGGGRSSDDTTAVVQPTTDGSGGAGSDTSTTSHDGSGGGSSSGGSSGSSSGSDGGHDSTTTATTTTTSSGSDGSSDRDGSG